MQLPELDLFMPPKIFRACYGVLRFIMESGAKGCEVVVSGKLRGQRAKSMKFVDGLMIHAGNPVREYVDTAVRHVLLRQGLYDSLNAASSMKYCVRNYGLNSKTNEY